ncbi:MAG: flagellar hook-basal body complex protein FliE [Desulfurococcales archaeon]|nr:flagellar hook-basal body complex protein FliE [Desulfurococcales archaeon]
MSRTLILVTGLPGSGKSIISEVVRGKEIPVVVMGDVVREEAVRRGVELLPENLSIVANDLRKKYGKAAIAIFTSEKIRENHESSPVIVVDGVRSLDEIAVFEELGNVCIIAVHASPYKRFERIRQRGRPGDPSDWDQFLGRDLVELSWGIGNVIALADYIVVNESTIEEAKIQSEKVVEEVLKSGGRGCSRGRGKAYGRR